MSDEVREMWEECLSCHGSGFVMVVVRDEVTDVPCSQCQGEGRRMVRMVPWGRVPTPHFVPGESNAIQLWREVPDGPMRVTHDVTLPANAKITEATFGKDGLRMRVHYERGVPDE
jgi:hypothetical protein